MEIFGDDMFGPLTRFLFRPTDEIQSIVDNFKREHFANYTVIGHQVRSLGMYELNTTLVRDEELNSSPAIL